MKKERMYEALELGERPTWDFNCWGATAYVLDMTDELYWWNHWQMDSLLEHETEDVANKRRRIGDILVLRRVRDGLLMHTAVYIGKGMYFHKMGSNNSSIMTYEQVTREYSYKNIAFRRVLNG